MIRWRMYRACAKEMNDLILKANIMFPFEIVYFLITGYHTTEFRKSALFSAVICFIFSHEIYRTYLHDIIFKRVEYVDACIYDQYKFITKDERRSLFGSKKNVPMKQFRLWTQSVDEDGNLMEYKGTCQRDHMYPDGNEFMSYDFKLYECIEEKTRQIPNIKVSKRREPCRYKKESLLYARISYMKSTNTIISIEFLGQKMNKVGA